MICGMTGEVIGDGGVIFVVINVGFDIIRFFARGGHPGHGKNCIP